MDDCKILCVDKKCMTRLLYNVSMLVAVDLRDINFKLCYLCIILLYKYR